MDVDQPNPEPDPRLVAQYEEILFSKLQEREDAYEQERTLREAAWAQLTRESLQREEAMQAKMQAMVAQLEKLQASSGTGPSIPMSTPPSDTPVATQAPPSTPPRRSSTPVSPRIRRSAGNRKASTNTPLAASSPKSNSTTPVQTPKSARQTRLKPAVKPQSQRYRLLGSEVSEDARSLKKAMTTHIRILSGLIDSHAVPLDPPDSVLQEFQNRVSDEASLEARRHGSPLLPLSLVQIGMSGSAASRGHVIRLLPTIEEVILQYMQSCLAKFGFTRWCPDHRQSPYSLYNSACRIIAIDTFKQAVVAHTYDAYQPNTTLLSNMDLLIKLYDHFVHHYLNERYKKNTRAPGSVQIADVASPLYRNRQRLAESRLEFLVQNNYPQRYRDLIDTKATSDDEADPAGGQERGRKIHWIKKRPERSERAEIFIRLLEGKMEQSAVLEGRRIRGRLRKIPETGQKNTDFLALPQGMPIDYFDPDYFNSLQPRLRGQCAVQKIALLPDADQSFSNSPDERLSDLLFMEKYGSTVMGNYRLDDLDGLDSIADEEWLVDDEDEDMYQEDEEDEDF